MNKSTIILLGALVVLGVVTFIATSEDAAPPAKTLTIAGYATSAQLDEEKGRKLLDGPLDIAHPIDEIILVKKGETIHLVRGGEGKQSTWKMTAPVEAVAVRYLVEKIATTFKTETASVFSRSLKEADLALYDLEPDLRIQLTLKSNGAIYNGADLIIGKVEKSGDAAAGASPEADTWVVRAGDLSTVYRIGGKDLRAPVAEDLSKLRDKKLFSFKAEDLERITVTPPSGDALELVGTRTEEPAAEEGKPPKVKVDWQIAKPPGFKADTAASAVGRSLANLRVQEFVAAKDAPEDALGKTRWAITAKPSGEAAETTVLVADTDQDVVWGQVKGKDELFKLAKYSAQNLKKTVADVRDKSIVTVDKGAVTGLVLAGAKGPIELARSGERWTFVRPKLDYPADPSAILGSLVRMKATRYATRAELETARQALSTPDIVGAIIVGDKRTPLAMSAKIDSEAQGLKGNRWAIVGTDPASTEPFVVADYVATRFKTNVAALRDKTVVSGGKDAIARIELFTLGAETAAVFERPANGGELTLVDVPEGKAASSQPIKTIVATLGNLKAKSIYGNISAADAGLKQDDVTRIVINTNDGKVATLLLSAKTKDDAVYASIDRGPLKGAVFTVNQYQAKNLKKTPAELIN